MKTNSTYKLAPITQREIEWQNLSFQLSSEVKSPSARPSLVFCSSQIAEDASLQQKGVEIVNVIF
jgi:hypothetical protein